MPHNKTLFQKHQDNNLLGNQPGLTKEKIMKVTMKKTVLKSIKELQTNLRCYDEQTGNEYTHAKDALERLAIKVKESK